VFKWLEKRMAAKIENDFESQINDIRDQIVELGIGMDVSKERVGEYKVRVERISTAGLWLAGFPEFVTYGPLDGMEPEVLAEVVGVYLDRDDRPRDGDEVILTSRRVHLRKIPDVNNLVSAFFMGLTAINRTEWQIHGYIEGFQVLGDLDPPHKHYHGVPLATRSVASPKKYNVDRTLAEVVRRRGESQGLML
jgi:hypothetical protein